MPKGIYIRTPKTPRTHCIHGHEYNEENTYVSPKGERRCRICKKETDLRWEEAHPNYGRETGRKNNLQRKYGITLEDYDQMLARQDGRCAICKNQPRTKRLAVDHDHKTGRIRGLLCMRCNRQGLGAFHDNAEIVQNAADYLAPPQVLFHAPPEILKYLKDLENALEAEQTEEEFNCTNG